MEEETASGHYLPPNTKVLTLITNNPRIAATKLWEQRKQSESISSDPSTRTRKGDPVVSSSSSSSSSSFASADLDQRGNAQQAALIKELQTDLNLSKMRIERLQQQWQQVKSRIAELRFAVQALFGYQLDIGRDDNKQRTYRTTSFYNPHLALTFVVSDNSLSLCDTTLPVESFERELYLLRKSKAIPYFLSSLTVRFFDAAAASSSAPSSSRSMRPLSVLDEGQE